MTNAEMLTKVRSFLDESAEDFYFDDEEIYPALSQAQREVAKTVADAWFYQSRLEFKPIPKAIQPLVASGSGNIVLGSNSFVVSGSPTPTILAPVSLEWNPLSTGTRKPTIFVSEGEILYLLNNKELVDGRYAWWNTSTFYVNPVSAHNSSSYAYSIIKSPIDISVSTQPTTDSVAHDAIVERAMWLLMKDREAQVAQLHLQLYGQLLQGLIK